MRLAVTAEVGRPLVPFVQKHLKRAFAAIQRGAAGTRRPATNAAALRDVHVLLVGDARMSDLHVQFMNVEGPTDVLTFPIDENQRGQVLSGEVYVCVPEARRAAGERKISPEHEVLLYALHGLLHLLGYDDRTDRDFRTMHRTEDVILTSLGLGPVFAAPPAMTAPPQGSAQRASKRPVRPRAAAPRRGGGRRGGGRRDSGRRGSKGARS